MSNLPAVLSQLNEGSYVGIFVLLALGGFVIPLPEEVLLLLVGYLIAAGVMKPWLAFLVSVAGVLVGDYLIYRLAKDNDSFLERLGNKVKTPTMATYGTLMKEHIGKSIFVLRFIVGLRFLGPLLAASMGIPWRVFQLYDALAVLVYVPVFLFLGWHFHSGIAAVVTKVTSVRHALTILMLAVVGLAITRYVQRRFFTQTS